jgi:hypothetical protein
VDDLVTWLRAQLDDDERAARAVEGIRMPWYFDHIDEAARPLVDLALDPARVLAEVDAKRRLLDLHPYAGLLSAPESCESCVVIPGPCPTLRLLALPYADRPGCRPEWRP